MKQLAAMGTPPIEQSKPWKAQILFWMGPIHLAEMPFQNVPMLHRQRATACLQSRMVDGVHPVLQHHRPLTSMETLPPACQMVKVDLGPIRFMSSKVKNKIKKREIFQSRVG